MTDTRPLALITGASSGIGLELARQFAGGGYDLLLVAEDDALDAAAAGLRAGGVQVQAVQADLRTEAGVEQVRTALLADGRPLDAAALNAGIGQGGAFVDQKIDDVLSLIDLNVRSTVLLAHEVLGSMVARGSGRVLVTSSIASTMPGPFQAVYNASKSFLQSFTKALQGELAGTGVTVTSLMPGPTDTNFFLRGDLLDTVMGSGPKDSPADVARQGYEALMAGRQQVVAASLMSKLMAASNAVLPDPVKVAAHRLMTKPRSSLR
ncbi:MAG TPA: SDR family NAD(P)-dependent oxidoreductase [Mycobacteriales bacterium]|jgi:short-subunit dehydrogenase|nr:SDR family NAD(P)-dependent oxidoreductase [Mycobacteriales bacterium]